MKISERVFRQWELLAKGTTLDRIPGVSIQEELSGADFVYLDSKASDALAELSSLLAHEHLDMDPGHIRELLLLQTGDIAWKRNSGTEPDLESCLTSFLQRYSQRHRETITVFAHLPTFHTESIVNLGQFHVGPAEVLERSQEDLVAITDLSSQTGCEFSIEDNPVVLSWTQRARYSARLLQYSLWLWARSDPETKYHGFGVDGGVDYYEANRHHAFTEIGFHSRDILEASGERYPSMEIVVDSVSVERWLLRGLSSLIPHISTPARLQPEMQGRALRAVHWYGRVCWSHDPDMVIVGSCCALEALFDCPGYRKAKKLATLVQACVEERAIYSLDRDIPIRQFIEELYSVRNSIVHEGFHSASSVWRYRSLLIVETAVINYVLDHA